MNAPLILGGLKVCFIILNQLIPCSLLEAFFRLLSQPVSRPPNMKNWKQILCILPKGNNRNWFALIHVPSDKHTPYMLSKYFKLNYTLYSNEQKWVAANSFSLCMWKGWGSCFAGPHLRNPLPLLLLLLQSFS